MGGARRVVILLFFRWSGVVGYRLIYFWTLDCSGNGRGRRKEGSEKATSVRLEREGKFTLLLSSVFYIFIFIYLIGRAAHLIPLGKEKKRNCYGMGFGRGGRRRLCFFPSKKTAREFWIMEFINWL